MPSIGEKRAAISSSHRATPLCACERGGALRNRHKKAAVKEKTCSTRLNSMHSVGPLLSLPRLQSKQNPHSPVDEEESPEKTGEACFAFPTPCKHRICGYMYVAVPNRNTNNPCCTFSPLPDPSHDTRSYGRAAPPPFPSSPASSCSSRTPRLREREEENHRWRATRAEKNHCVRTCKA